VCDLETSRIGAPYIYIYIYIYIYDISNLSVKGDCKMKGFCGRTSEKLFDPTENVTRLKFIKRKQQTITEFGEGTRTSKVVLRYGQMEYSSYREMPTRCNSVSEFYYSLF